MPSLIPDVATFERRLEGLPVVKHRAREVVLTAGSKTGALLFLRSGAVEVVKDGVQIASVNAPGSVFGEQAVLLDQPHTADVRTLEQSEFYVADAPAILAGDPTVTLYVAAILARRLQRDGEKGAKRQSPDWRRSHSTPPTDGLSRLSASSKPASLPASSARRSRRWSEAQNLLHCRSGICAARLLFVFGADRNLSSRSLMRSSLASILRR